MKRQLALTVVVFAAACLLVAYALPQWQSLTTALKTVSANDARFKDWADLGRYRENNRNAQKPDVVFMGDSITDVWQLPQFGGFFPGKAYADRGISGQTTPQMLIRFRPDVVDLGPKVVVILAGTNDIAGNTGPMTNETIEGNLMSMADIAVANRVRVVLASLTPVSEYHIAYGKERPQTTQRPIGRIRTLNAWIKTYAEAHGHVYLDYFSSMVDARGLLKAEYSDDDLHPNAAGYAVMAPLAEAAIAAALR